MTLNISLLFGLLLAGSLSGNPLDNTALDAIRSEATRNHPSAKAAANRTAAAAEEVRAVRLWDDPVAGVAFMAPRNPQMRRDEGDLMATVEIPLPKPGLYSANLLKAGALLRAENETSIAVRLESGIQATLLAIELALADETVRLSSGELEWLSEMEANAMEMSLDPLKTSIDPIRLTAEKIRLEQSVAASRRTREGLARQLNIVMGKSLDHSWPTLSLPVNPPPVPLAASEIARIPYANPRVRAMAQMQDAAAADVQITDRERLPSISAGIETRGYSGDGYRSTTLGLKMSLPWFNRENYQAKVDAAKFRTQAAAADTETLRREIASQVVVAATEAANAAAQATAYAGEIRKKTIEANESIQASWINSKAPLTDLLESRRLLFSVDLEQRRFIAMQLAAIEKLNFLVPSR